MKSKGFTLIELIVVLAVIAILAAILTPVIGRYIDDARRSTAAKDVKNLAAAITMFYKDVGSYPGWRTLPTTDEGTAYELLISVSNATGADDPGDTGGTLWDDDTSAEDTMDNHLLKNTPGGSSSQAYRTTGRFIWRGPYQQEFREDPWGNYYCYNAKFIPPAQAANALIVVSAGPDEDIDTTFEQVAKSFAVGDDDIHFQLR